MDLHPTRTRVKICCIRDREELATAVNAGADAVGFVSTMPSGPGVIEEQVIEELMGRVPPGVTRFLLTRERNGAAIAGQARRCHPQVLQLCDRPESGAYDRIRAACPGLRLVQVVHVNGPAAVEDACRVEGEVDALLLDSGQPHGKTKTLGGTGRVHDWLVSTQIREAVRVPVFLAGGLHAGNVRAAIEQVRPYGVDVCSGVRTDDRLAIENVARVPGCGRGIV